MNMGKRVLVVDDANFMRMVVKNTLEPRGSGSPPRQPAERKRSRSMRS